MGTESRMSTNIDDYEVICVIGSGSYGTCKKVRRKKDNKIVVWKELNYGSMTESEKQMLVSEVNLLRELKHRHIVHYYDRVIDRAHATLYIIMEYCEGGDLASFIAAAKKSGVPVEERLVWRWGEQVLLALRECHSRQRTGHAVLHRDIKPANVFLDAAANVKLGDFGLARVLNHDTSFARTFVGTPYYMSPEQINYMSYNEKSDIWSVGCLLYELCALRPPFTAANRQALASRISCGQFQRIPARYSDDLNNVVCFLLNIVEDQRPTIEQVLRHPLVVKHTAVKTATATEKRPSTTSGGSSADDGYASKMESLRRQENAFKQHMKDSQQKLELREKAVTLREKLVEEKLARCEKMVQEASNPTATAKAPTGGATMISCERPAAAAAAADVKKRVSFLTDLDPSLPSADPSRVVPGRGLDGGPSDRRLYYWQQLQGGLLPLEPRLWPATRPATAYYRARASHLLGIR